MLTNQNFPPFQSNFGMSQLALIFLLIFVLVPTTSSNIVLGDADPSNLHAVLFSTVPSDDKKWWVNYAAEAEIARTYHWLRDHGVPAKNIILFMSGNFVHHEKNPFPGTLYTDRDLRRNYAEGLQIDYSGSDVTVDNYLAVLRGEKDRVRGGSGRVLNRSVLRCSLPI
jgi:glycosylphosphatidylinositol transamidase (GPIT) subunit GPI8